MYNQPLPKVTKPNFSSSLILLLLLFLLVGGIGGYYLGSNSFPQPSNNPPDQRACTMDAKLCPDGTSVGRVPPNCDFAPCPPTQPSSTPDETANWKVYDALKDGFIENEKYGNFTFKYPPEFELDHASGPGRDFFGGTDLILIGESIHLTISFVGFNGSSQDQAIAFVHGILNNEASIPISCELLPNCNSNTFSIHELTSTNNLRVSEVSGPYYDGEVFDLYFLQPNKNTSLSFWFSYKDREKWKQTRDQILFTFKFLN